jgi:hypothetical protein
VAGVAVPVLVVVLAAAAGCAPEVRLPPAATTAPDTEQAPGSQNIRTSDPQETLTEEETPSPEGTRTDEAGGTDDASSGGGNAADRRVPKGFPSAADTGVAEGVELEVVRGDQVFGTDGEIVEGKVFHGFVKVTGRNITFKNCVFRGRAAGENAALLDTEQGTGTVVLDSDFAPTHPSALLDGLWTKNTKIIRADVRGTVDGVKANRNTLIQDSFIHDLSWFAADPNQDGGETHNDGVQSFAGESGVTLLRNTIDVSTTKRPNAALQTSADDTHVRDNYLDGGACVLNFDHTPLGRPLTGIQITGNRFGRNSFYDCPIILSTQSKIAKSARNVWHDTGKSIPAPEQHD